MTWFEKEYDISHSADVTDEIQISTPMSGREAEC